MSAENPAVPLSQADEDMHDLFSGPASASGVRVSRNRALGYSAIWRGVHLIANGVARLPFRVYTRKGELKEPAPSHQAARVMRRPNDYMTPFTFRQTVQAHALLDGNGYAYIARGIDSQPLELLPLHPSRTWPVRANGVLWYVTELSHDETLKGRRRKRHLVKIPAADMLHVKGLGFDGLCGYPVLKILRDAVGAAIAARDYGTRYFNNNARPGVVLEVPAGMKETAVANLRDSWERLHAGISAAHKTAILRDGVKLVVYEANARDAQLLENRQFDARDVANIIGVPPHKLGDPSKTAYNSLESENQSYLDDTLDPWLAAWEQEADSKLLTEWEKETESHCCEFTREAILRVNLKDRADYYVKAITTGWLNRDEVRHAENLNPIPDGKGKEFVLPVNVAPAKEPGAGDADPAADPPADPPADDKANPMRSALRALAADVVGRMVRRLATNAERLAKRPAELRSWLSGGMLAEHGDTITAALAPLVAAARALNQRADEPLITAAGLATGFGAAAMPLIGSASDLPGAVRAAAAEYERSAVNRFPMELFP